MAKDIRDGIIIEIKDTRDRNSRGHTTIIIDYHHLLYLQDSMERTNSKGDECFQFKIEEV